MFIQQELWKLINISDEATPRSSAHTETELPKQAHRGRSANLGVDQNTNMAVERVPGHLEFPMYGKVMFVKVWRPSSALAMPGNKSCILHHPVVFGVWRSIVARAHFGRGGVVHAKNKNKNKKLSLLHTGLSQTLN